MRPIISAVASLAGAISLIGAVSLALIVRMTWIIYHRAMIASTAMIVAVQLQEGARAIRPDDRAPAGPDLCRPAGHRQASRGGRLRAPLPVRPLPELSWPVGRADDRCLGRPRRPRPGNVTHRARGADVAGHL